MADETTPAEPTADATAKPKKAIAIAALVGGIVIGGAAGALFVGPLAARTLGYAPAAADSAAHAPDSAEGEHGEGGAPANAVYMVDNLVLNPAGSGGTRFLMVAVALELKDEKAKEELTRRDAEVRDLILGSLGERTVEQLSDVSARDSIKTELVDQLSKLLPKSPVRRLYFPQFVIQ